VVNNEHFLIAFSTVIMGAFTFVLAIATPFLYLATRALVKGGEKNAERQLRAYVLVTGKGLVEQSAEEERLIHQFEIRNTGLTPAYKLQVESMTRPLPHPLPHRFDFAITPAGRNPSVMMLGSGQPVRHDSNADEPLSQHEMDLIKRLDSGCRLYTFGTLTPVRFPPGRLMLATRPALTGSAPPMKTIGIVVVASFAARAVWYPDAMTFTRRLTSSAASAGTRSGWLFAKRYSTTTFRPSTKSLSAKPRRNAMMIGWVFSADPA
jgi:hypothetical protein